MLRPTIKQDPGSMPKGPTNSNCSRTGPQGPILIFLTILIVQNVVKDKYFLHK